MQAWLGLGANLQHPVMQLKRALKRLRQADGIEVTRISSFYRTPPWGYEYQDEFINAVAQIETTLNPLDLLGALQSIEDSMGRQRSKHRWGPRLIDIDLLLFGDMTIQCTELEVPHPRIYERAFVLLPLAELDATIEIPGQGVAGALLSQLDCNGIYRLDKTDEQ